LDHYRQAQPDDACKKVGPCMMPAQSRPNMVTMALRQQGKLTGYG